MKCALLIGTETTAQTTLEHWLYDNRGALARQGVALSDVLGRPNNRLLVSYVGEGLTDPYFRVLKVFNQDQRDQHFADFAQRFEEEVGRARTDLGAETFLIISKHFYSILNQRVELERLAALLQRSFDEVRVYCTVREQSEMILSLYSRALRNGHAGTLEQFSARLSLENPMFNHHAALSMWADVFGHGQMDVVRYDAGLGRDEACGSEVLARAAPAVSSKGFKAQPRRRSARLGPLLDASLRAVNAAAHAVPDPEALKAVTRRLARAIEHNTTLPLPMPPHPEADAIRAMFGPANRALARDFLDVEGDPFPPRPALDDAERAAIGATLERFGDAVDRGPLEQIALSHEWTARLDVGDGLAVLRSVAALGETDQRLEDALNGFEGCYRETSERWDALRTTAQREGRSVYVDDALALLQGDRKFLDRQRAALSPARRCFVIYFTPRSGSSWLTDTLHSSGVLGHPGEWLNPASLPKIAARYKVNTFDDYCDMLLRTQKDQSGMFSIEVSWDQLSQIRGLDRFYKHFPMHDAPIFLIRENIVRQAVSLYKATETNVFHTKLTSQQDIERSQSFDDYDGQKILKWLVRIESQEAHLEALFAERGIRPLRLSYERMFADEAGTLKAIADWVGVQLPTHSAEAVDDTAHRPMAGQSNDHLELRFRREFKADVARLEAARRATLKQLSGAPAPGSSLMARSGQRIRDLLRVKKRT